MDKSTFSKWGGVVVAVLVIAIMISFASPFGQFISSGVKSTLINFKNATVMPYTVKLTTNIPEAGTAEFTGDGHNGTTLILKGEHTLTFTATCNPGYQFLGWYVGDTLISTDAVYTEGYTVSGRTTIEARFEAYLEPGLYETGTKTMKTPWDELISSGILDSNGKIVSGQEASLAGDLVLPNTWTSVPSSAFYNCTGLTGVNIPDSVTSIGSEAFRGCSGLTSIDIPDGVTSIGSSAFFGCSSLTSIDIPDGVTSIGMWAFRDCSSMTSITIPDGVTRIQEYTYSGCSSLTSFSIPDGITSIGHRAFYGCSGLTSIDIPDSVTSIGSSAFSGCSGLTSITIPDGVTSIQEAAFYKCSGLTSITVLAETPPTLGSEALFSLTALTEIKVPAASVDAYKAAYRWSSFADKIVAID